VVDPTVGSMLFDHLSLAHVDPDGRELRVTLYTPRPGESTTRARRLFGPVTP
jgi:hypothetical protein